MSAPVHRVSQAKHGSFPIASTERAAVPPSAAAAASAPGSSSPAPQKRKRRPRDGFTLRARLGDRSLELGRLVLLPTPRASHHGEVGHGLTQRAALVVLAVVGGGVVIRRALRLVHFASNAPV